MFTKTDGFVNMQKHEMVYLFHVKLHCFTDCNTNIKEVKHYDEDNEADIWGVSLRDELLRE